MQLIWNRAESKEQPLAVDEVSSISGVYLRKDIVFEDDKYVYDEAYLSKEDYQVYKITSAIELKHDDDVVDSYTLQLIEEGIL